MDTQPRVVVTGMGVVAPNGIGLDAYWDSLINCKSGIGPITLFDTKDFTVKIAGEVRDFDLRDYFGRDCKPNRLGRQTQLGLVACRMAIEHAGLTKEIFQRATPLNLVVGICSSAADIIESAKELIIKHGPDRVRPYMVGACQPHAISAAFVQLLDVQTSVSTISSACPSGLDAIETAAKMIKKGEADLVIAGAADSPLNATGLAGFAATGVLSKMEDPKDASRPFDLQRDGVVLAEGAGFVVLERLDSALARGATPIVEVAGAATITDIPGTGGMEGLFHSMNRALINSGVYPEQVDYICANALSHPGMDKAEVAMIKKLFGNYAYQIPVSSIRGVMGHPLAPSGIFQAIACALMIKNQMICPTANLHNPDPECDLDHVPLTPRKAKVNIALANGHGMGGENSTLVIKRIL